MTDTRDDSPTMLDRIHTLVETILTGAEAAESRSRLEHLVSTDSDAADLYVTYMQDTVLLEEIAERDGDVDVSWLLDLPTAAALPENSRPAPDISSAERSAARGPARPVVERPVRDEGRVWRRRFNALCAGLAGLAALTLVAFLARSSSDVPAREVARLQRSTGAHWTRDGKPITLQEGASILSGRYILNDGMAHIQFPWGTEVALEAPAAIDLRPDDSRWLSYGKLIARVPPADNGFTIETPSATVVDLGTEFGLDVNLAGDSEVHVFKGEVETRAGEGGRSQAVRIAAGEAMSFHASAPVATDIHFNPNRFARAWQQASRVVETSGAVRFVHPQPPSVVEGQTESNERIVLFLERVNVTLDSATAVTLTQPGLYTTFHDNAWLPDGLDVDSYALHFDPVGSSPTQPPVSSHGSVKFDRPILAVIARGDQLSASDAQLAHPDTQYLIDPHREAPYYSIRGLCGLHNMKWQRPAPAPNDRLRISRDRRTLTLTCAAGGEADQVRVLVAATEADATRDLMAPRLHPPTPFHGRPFEVGETIEAEDFDQGGAGVAYFDTTPNTVACFYRPGVGVELPSVLKEESETILVGQPQHGEWLAYTVSIAEAGRYVVAAHVASNYGGGTFHVEFGEETMSAPMTIPKTDGGRVFQTVRSEPLSLARGRHIMRIVMDEEHRGGYIGNIDGFRIEPAP